MPSIACHRVALGERLADRLETATAVLTGLATVAVLFSIAASQILLGAALLSLLLSRRTLEFPARLGLPLLAFIGWTLLSLAFSSAPLEGLSQVRKLYAFLIPLLVYNAFREPRAIWRIVQGVVLAGVVSALYGLGQFVETYLDFQRRGLPFYENYITHQITGFMSHWMTFSGQLMMVLLLIASVLLFSRPAKRGAWWWLSLPAGGLALLAAFTRGVWLATLLGMVYLLARSYRRLLWLFPVGVLLLYLLSPPWLQEREGSIFRLESDTSNQSRLVMFRTGLEMIAAHPLLGVGPERVGPEFLRYKPAELPLPPAWYGHLHNTYLQIAAERGIPCLLLWLWLLGQVMRDSLALASHPAGQSRALGHAGVAITLGMMVGGLFEFNFGDSEVLMLYLFLIAAGYAWTNVEKQSSRGTAPAGAGTANHTSADHVS